MSPLTHPTATFEDTVANGEFMFATVDHRRLERAAREGLGPAEHVGLGRPAGREGDASAIYNKVFTVFGAITLAVVGLYLLWRSRQSDMSNAMTTAGWAIFVMVAVTAIAAWPVRSAHLADSSLISGLDVVHSAIGPDRTSTPPDQCALPDPDACVDHRPPAVRASDTATETHALPQLAARPARLRRQPDREEVRPGALRRQVAHLGRGRRRSRQHPGTRDGRSSQASSSEWTKVAEQIKTEDPRGVRAICRATRAWTGSAPASSRSSPSLFFAMFDITASLLVLLGFLIFRWAVIAAPILGTIGLLRPASAGLRRLANAVVAAIFNIVIFGTGAAIYLFAVDLIMSTPTLPGWLQVVLVWLCGVVGWLLLRPYRRITQLGGKDSTEAVARPARWHRRFFRDCGRRPGSTSPSPAAPRDRRRGADGGRRDRASRPEARTEDPTVRGAAAAVRRRRGAPAVRRRGSAARPAHGRRRRATGPSRTCRRRPRTTRSTGRSTSPSPATGPRPAGPESSPVGG